MFQNVPECMQNVPECSRMYEKYPECSSMFQTVCRVCQNVPKCMHNVPDCCRKFQNVCRMFQNVCKMFQIVPECSRMFQNVLESSRLYAECSKMYAECMQIHELACTYISLHAVTGYITKPRISSMMYNFPQNSTMIKSQVCFVILSSLAFQRALKKIRFWEGWGPKLLSGPKESFKAG